MLKALLAAFSAGAACFLFYYFQGEEVPILVNRGLFAAGAAFFLSLLIVLLFRIAKRRRPERKPIPDTPFDPPEIITLHSKTPEQLDEERKQKPPPMPRGNPFSTRH